MTITEDLVRIGVKWVDDTIRFAVDCRACGPNVQVTGLGGFATIREAAELAQKHRQEHLEALLRELTPTP